MRTIKVIYDFGANNGDDLPYYLKKSDLVIACEANPYLCEVMTNRFQEAINSGRLKIFNCILTTEKSSPSNEFYIHKKNHVLSTFCKPDESAISEFQKIYQESKNVIDLIREYGSPYYIKIDLEGYDINVLKCLFNNNIFPDYISCESHVIDVFCTLVSLGDYKSFKMVSGPSVSIKYRDAIIKIKSPNEKTEKMDFPSHSAGPFGEDIHGEWMTRDNFFKLLSNTGLGWIDIHASKIDSPNPGYQALIQSVCPPVVSQRRRSNWVKMRNWITGFFRGNR